MYYASFGLLALILHCIINHEVFRKTDQLTDSTANIRYQHFLISLVVYYISDILWGILYEFHYIPLVYTDTVIYFLTMVLSVFLWTRYVVAYLGKNGLFSNVLTIAGRMIFLYELVMLIINFFYPIVFWFGSDKAYRPGSARYFTLGIQVLLYVMAAVYTLIVASKTDGKDKIHNLAIGFSGIVMTIFIILQTFFPLLPFYALGCLIGTSLIHICIMEDEKLDHDREIGIVRQVADREHLENEKVRKEREVFNQIATSLAEDYEAIYYIDIETGRYREFSPSKTYESMDIPKYWENFYRETKENARRFAHPDDRGFAESLYDKETMLKNLEGKKSCSFKYRIMVNGEARYFRFEVMRTDDGKHFVLFEKDIHDEITAETARMETQKRQVTFGQIAESLASNYDAIYYVNMADGNYVSYTFNHIYRQLEVKREGEDFFRESRKNLEWIIHPQDKDRLIGVIDRDYLISKLEDRKQFDVDYRLMIDESPHFTRLSVRKSSDNAHFIIVVENIDDEVKKEKEQLIALNNEKELARRDELTGTKNKTAYSELERSIQGNIDKGIDYLPFAIAVCDINDLKKINDTRGHKAGDEYIRASAKLLCDIFAHSPVFRIGGDEFVIFLRGDDYTIREELVAGLQKKALENLAAGSGPVMAVGVSHYDPKHDSRVSEIFERADNRMYEDKRSLKARKV